MKISKKTYNLLSRGMNSMFKINRDNQYEFTYGPYKYLTIDFLYEQAKVNDREYDFIDQLEELKVSDKVNLKDIVNIHRIIKELKMKR